MIFYFFSAFPGTPETGGFLFNHLYFSPGRGEVDWISGLARPGSKGVSRKNHEAGIDSWIGRALYLVWYRAGKPFFLREQGYSDVGAPGRAPCGPAPFCGSPAGSANGILFPPMLFPRNALVSGPQTRFRAETGAVQSLTSPAKPG